MFETTLNHSQLLWSQSSSSAGVLPGIKPASQSSTTQQLRRKGQCTLRASDTQTYDNTTRRERYWDPPFTEEETEAQSQVSNLPKITQLKTWKPGHQWGLTLTSPLACTRHTALPGYYPHSCSPSSAAPCLCLVPQSCRLFVTPGTAVRQAPLPMGILQARMLEWVAMSFSRGSSQPRDWTQVSSIAGGFFTIWATRETPAEKTAITDKETAFSHCLPCHLSAWLRPAHRRIPA